MNKEKIKNIIYIVVAILLSYFAIHFMIWVLPFILVALLAYFIYEKLKTSDKKVNSNKKKKKKIVIIDEESHDNK
ncbi:MAG: hypothetical protein SO108_00750 [Bacilli bacterium]|nr:hypothetical protein [Bacilli bacterium]